MSDGQRQKNEIEEPASLYASRDRTVFFNNPPSHTESSNRFFNAVLVRAIVNLFELPESPNMMSKIIRQWSWWACKSLFGGYVA